MLCFSFYFLQHLEAALSYLYARDGRRNPTAFAGQAPLLRPARRRPRDRRRRGERRRRRRRPAPARRRRRGRGGGPRGRGDHNTTFGAGGGDAGLRRRHVRRGRRRLQLGRVLRLRARGAGRLLRRLRRLRGLPVRRGRRALRRRRRQLRGGLGGGWILLVRRVQVAGRRGAAGAVRGHFRSVAAGHGGRGRAGPAGRRHRRRHGRRPRALPRLRRPAGDVQLLPVPRVLRELRGQRVLRRFFAQEPGRRGPRLRREHPRRLRPARLLVRPGDARRRRGRRLAALIS